MSIEKDTRFWDNAAKKYARSAISDEAGYQRTLKRTCDYLAADDRVLELGCGTGTTALCLAAHVNSYLATDISSEMIAIARKKQKAEPPRGLQFAVGTAEAVPETTLFNAILCFNYLHLVRDLKDTLHRIHSLLAQGGILVSKTPCVGDMSALIKYAIPVMRAIGKAPYAGVFEASELELWIKQAGFEIITIEDHATRGNEVRPYIVAQRV